MIDYSWFRLLVRAIGILLIGLSLPHALMSTVHVIDTLLTGNWSQYGWSGYFGWVGSIVGLLLQAGFGFYLLSGGGRLVERCLRGVYGWCPHCGYDVRTIPAANCPECGSVLPGRALIGAPTQMLTAAPQEPPATPVQR